MMVYLTDEDNRRVVTGSADPHEAARMIVDIANERGGLDNISTVILSSKSSNEGNGGQVPL